MDEFSFTSWSVRVWYWIFCVRVSFSVDEILFVMFQSGFGLTIRGNFRFGSVVPDPLKTLNHTHRKLNPSNIVKRNYLVINYLFGYYCCINSTRNFINNLSYKYIKFSWTWLINYFLVPCFTVIAECFTQWSDKIINTNL